MRHNHKPLENDEQTQLDRDRLQQAGVLAPGLQHSCDPGNNGNRCHKREYSAIQSLVTGWTIALCSGERQSLLREELALKRNNAADVAPLRHTASAPPCEASPESCLRSIKIPKAVVTISKTNKSARAKANSLVGSGFEQ
jgi:hypothetical protein